MTDTAPQILQSRQLAVPGQPVMQTAAMARMDAEFRMAQAIARAGAEMLPRAYREKPGAVILVQQWANAHEVDILTAMQTVSFVDGKPIIDATMQRAMAERAGYDVEVIEADRTHAIVQVTPPGKMPRRSEYTWEDAGLAGLTGKNNWKKNPEDMLVARATTRALKRHAPSVMLGFVDPDDAGEQDMVEVLAQTPAPAQDASGGEAEAVDAGRDSATPDAEPPDAEPATDVVDVEVVDEPETEQEPTEVADETPAEAEPAPEPIADPNVLGDEYTGANLSSTLKAKGLRQSDAIRVASGVAESLSIEAPGTVQQIAAGPVEIRRAVAAWVNAGGEV